jgi:A/G-specific adenine glycosylase
MLQQTRVEAVIPYYRRFLERFPDAHALAAAPEPDVLTAWSGLGYYSRARNLHRAARQIAADGFPASFDAVLSLSGVGPYTAAAIASIALNLAHAAVDGNVIRVISRLTNDASEITQSATRQRFTDEAERLLDRDRPGDFNQAMMELGATVCLPRVPLCGQCPVARSCAARAEGRERMLPVKLKKNSTRDVMLELILLEQDEAVFLVQRDAGDRRLAGFWELPERALFGGIRGAVVAEFSHQIVNDRFRVEVRKARTPKQLPEGRWFAAGERLRVPMTTITRKALAAVSAAGS